jgi:riboflavin synthase
MFTGLVETTGILAGRAFQDRAGSLTLAVDAWREEPIAEGDSIAVEGVCLTVTGRQAANLSFDVLAETFRRSNLGRKPEGARMNLERALAFGDRLGGHIVNGHVDGVGEVVRVSAAGRDWVLGVNCETALAQGLVYKGCVCCNGVSLTISALTENGFETHLIPETWRVTSLCELQPGDPVNLEIDIVGKYVRQCLEQGRIPPPLSWDALRRTGLLSDPAANG